jgi:hypothetical protein
MSFVEYYLHGYVLHQKNVLPAFLYRWFPAIEMERYEHSELHHGRYYTVFNYEPDPVGKDLAQRIGWKTTIIGFLFFLPLMLLVGYFISPIPPLVFAFTGLFYVGIWNTIHPEMHQPKHPWWSKLAPYRYLARYHFVHHDNHRKGIHVNENLVLPFADFLFGRHARATTSQEAEMRRIGLQ